VADFAKIKQLEAQIAADQQRYSDIERDESKLTENIPLQGFNAFSMELKYRSEKEHWTSPYRKRNRSWWN
jgi:hypothetical protein